MGAFEIINDNLFININGELIPFGTQSITLNNDDINKQKSLELDFKSLNQEVTYILNSYMDTLDITSDLMELIISNCQPAITLLKDRLGLLSNSRDTNVMMLIKLTLDLDEPHKLTSLEKEDLYKKYNK